MIFLGGLIILFFLVMYLASTYHRLASLRNRCEDARSQLALVLKKYPSAAQSAEGEISRARQAYNDSVTTYNKRRKTFPANLIAILCNFAPMEPSVR